ncbi:hypothetical protein KIN20_018022 [Parelaphostrongylus tenuis]|uniref:Uncharacterized protein n=1 Tax=Parelaphostrongylus tenuis TaxID=148309 RepID=A0AAD5MP69_PARTN|nr:hypothetical protein KIN20_018022 [Parelaphostrongylus tenuis]
MDLLNQPQALDSGHCSVGEFCRLSSGDPQFGVDSFTQSYSLERSVKPSTTESLKLLELTVLRQVTDAEELVSVKSLRLSSSALTRVYGTMRTVLNSELTR